MKGAGQPKRFLAVPIMASSNGNIFRVTGPLCGEFTGPGEFPAQRPVTRSFDVSFDLRSNKRLSKQWRGWWFETQSCPLWRHRNGCLDHRQQSLIPLKQWTSHTHSQKIRHKCCSTSFTVIVSVYPLMWSICWCSIIRFIVWREIKSL